MKRVIIDVIVIIGLAIFFVYGINNVLYAESSSNSNFEKFKSEWYNVISKTKYERYSGHVKSINQSICDKGFNCYDGAYVTSYLANKHHLRYEIIHGQWEGVGHAAVKIYKSDGTSEIFDTKQKQEGYGQNGAENQIIWDRTDFFSTFKSKFESEMLSIRL